MPSKGNACSGVKDKLLVAWRRHQPCHECHLGSLGDRSRCILKGRPEDTAILSESRSREVCRKHSSEVNLRPLLKPARLFSSQTRKISDFRSFHCIEPAKNETPYVLQCNNPKSDSVSFKRTPLERNFSAECIQRRHSSTCQPRQPSNVECHFVELNQKVSDTVIDVKNLKIHEKDGADPSIEKGPRTYAQMIANYSQTIYTETSTGILKDGLSMAMINGVHRSPFSTASMVSLKWNSKPKVIKSGCVNVSGPCTINQKAKFNSDTSATRYEFRNDHKDVVIGGIEESKLERSFSSYATMIERYSNSLDLARSSNLVPRRNASTKLNDFATTLPDAKDKPMELASSNKNQGTVEGSSETGRKEGETWDQIDWMAKVEDVIKGLKRITAKKEADSNLSEKWALQSVNERAEWLDRVVSAHKKRKPTAEKTANFESKGSTVVASNSNRDSTVKPVQMASSSSSSSIADYIKRGPVRSSTTTSSSPPTAASGSAKQPQIELRMTPSQNESVVSINVDEPAVKTAGAGIKEQLSVVISSKGSKLDTSSANVRSNFDSMQISISENTIPVKQIEFSINGKPVSELKSIVARANKLDVVSSIDKVEIRIPQDENANVAREQTPNVARSGPNSKQVLNLQIAAKFNEPRAQKPRDTGVKTSTTVPPSPITTGPTPTPKPTPIPTPTQVPPYKPPRTHNFSPFIETPNVTNESNVKGTEVQADASSLTKKEKFGTPLTVKSNDAVFQGSDMNKPTMDTPQPTLNENPNAKIPKEDRAPSNNIPWWSSEDSFRNIKKKENKSVFDDKLMKKVEEDTGVTLDFEQALNPGVKSADLVNFRTSKKPVSKEDKSLSNVASNFRETETSSKIPATKSVLKEKEGSSKQMFRTVRVRSPSKLVPIKRVGGIRVQKKGVGRVVKKVRYRVKRPKVSAARTKGSEKPTISAVRSPKVVKYVPVNPQKVFVGENPETSMKAIGPGGEKAESNVEGPKNEKAIEANTKLKKIVEDASRASKTNVHHSDTIFKATKNLGKAVNKSADIPAKLPTVRGRGAEQDKRDLPSTKVSVEAEPDQRMKQILKSMKPIEKRKDGTLIDYGVVVPSRTPPMQFRPVPRTRSNAPFGKFDKKKETPNQEKIVEPQKVFSVKKQTLTKPKSEPRANIVEPEKISSVKKPIESTNTEAKRGKIELSESQRNKQTLDDQKYLILAKKDNLQSQKRVTSKSIESKTNTSTSSVTDKNQPLKATGTESFKNLSKINKSNLHEKLNVSSKVNVNSSKLASPDSGVSKSTLQTENKENTLKGTLPVIPFKRSVKTSDTNVNFLKSTSPKKSAQRSVNLKKHNSKNTLKPGSQEKEKSEGTLSVPPSKTSIKASDTNVTNFSKLKSLDKPTKPRLLEEIARPTRTADKKVTGDDPLPLTETIASPPPQEFTDKATKNNSKSSAESIVESEKKVISPEITPLEGTINYQPVKKLNNLDRLRSINKGKKTMSEVIKQRRKDLCAISKIPKSSLGKGSGTPGSNGPTGTSTGPAGLQSSRSFTVSQICSKTTVSCMEKESERIDGDLIFSRSKRRHNDEIKLNGTERQEKNILYSSWLQRFKSQVDDKII